MVELLPDAVEDRLHELFLDDLDSATRQAGVRELIVRHPELREGIDREVRFLQGGSAMLGTLRPDPRGESQPTVIGPYRILRKLGEGGFGTVWLGEQSVPLQRLVAIKRIRLGMDTERVLQRFAIERRALEQMDHPGIAKVLDAGRCDDGRPFLALEFVDGLPLIDYCRRHDLGLEARIELMLDIVDAVHHAHQRGILHRDLKPANLLVAELDGRPRPRIIDFGLARVLDHETEQLTREGQHLGTPEYMSPEQLRGDVDLDLRVDVHALGMVLFELLVGDLPIPRDRWRMTPPSTQVELMTTGEPPRPSSRIGVAAIARRVRGELDWIVLRALARDRERRYRSAAALGDDLRRFLQHQPVSAGPPSRSYAARKFLRRHRLLAGAALAVVSSLAVGLGISLRLYALAEERAVAAAANLADYDRLADALTVEELERLGDELWPPVPSRLAELSACARRLEDLLERLPDHRDTLTALQTRMNANRSGDGMPIDVRTAFLADRLGLLIEALDRVGAADGLRASLDSRIRVASTLQRRTIDEPAEAWQRTVAAVADDPRFAGCGFPPQLGLVPIGEDPATHLQEFVHLASGSIPERDVDGRLHPAAEHGIVLVLVPGGTFAMGTQDRDPRAANHDRDADADSTPIVEVTLAPFFLGKFEVTRAQWLRLARHDPSFDPTDPEGRRADRAVLPVTRMAWTDATRAARRWDLELPTEAQWEYACRAGTATTWFTGPDPASLQGYANIGDRTFGAEWGGERPHTGEVDDGFMTTAPIGSFRPNALGLHDMVGNVAEHVVDQYVRYTEPCRTGDGRRPVDDDKREGRVIRGGSYHHPAQRCSSGFRDGNLPDGVSMWIGLRVARRIDP